MSFTTPEKNYVLHKMLTATVGSPDGEPTVVGTEGAGLTGVKQAPSLKSRPRLGTFILRTYGCFFLVMKTMLTA